MGEVTRAMQRCLVASICALVSSVLTCWVCRGPVWLPAVTALLAVPAYWAGYYYEDNKE